MIGEAGATALRKGGVEHYRSSVDLFALTAAAALTGLVHALLGPDHYLPFVAMARAGRWSLPRTLAVTVACGIGHVLSSVALGIVGLLIGLALFSLETLEAVRGQVAGWLLLGFGLAYFAWGVHRAIRNRPHSHVHVHEEGVVHRHEHGHADSHVHVHNHDAESVGSLTPWVLFTIFIFGPCEPLIPLFIYPAAAGEIWHVALVTIAFTATTVIAMTVAVTALYLGASKLHLGRFERYAHAAGGLVLVACGVAVTAGL